MGNLIHTPSHPSPFSLACCVNSVSEYWLLSRCEQMQYGLDSWITIGQMNSHVFWHLLSMNLHKSNNEWSISASPSLVTKIFPFEILKTFDPKRGWWNKAGVGKFEHSDYLQHAGCRRCHNTFYNCRPVAPLTFLSLFVCLFVCFSLTRAPP